MNRSAVAETGTEFRSFGEQLQAVIEAGRPGGEVDPRLSYALAEARAASGGSELTPSEGGFLIQPNFSTRLLERTYEVGAITSRVEKIPVTGSGLKINTPDETSRANGSRWGGVLSGWVAESDALSSSNPKFSQLAPILKKLAGLCYATDEMVEDMPALEAVLMRGFAEEFSFRLEDAIVNGTGAGLPLGILNSGALITVSKETGQLAATIVAENIVKMWGRCWGASRKNAVWLVNQDIESQLYTMGITFGTGGQGIFSAAAGQSPYATLMGRPVIPVEYCATLGTVGDIILGDFSQYLVIDKGAPQGTVSIHIRFLNDEQAFRFVYRVDGQPIWNAPVNPKNGTITLSPFVALATRA